MKKSILLSLYCMALGIFSAYAQFSFTADQTSGCTPLTVTFTNTTTDTNAYRYLWDYGDGYWEYDTLTTTLSHTFTLGGWYWVYMQVYDSLNNYIGFFNVNISVQSLMNLYPDSVCPGDNVNFCGATPGSSWYWDFGDGYTSTNQCPQHAYATSGDYIVTLIETTDCGTDTISDTAKVRSSIPSDASFGYNPNPSCPDDQVNFYPYTNGGIHFWDFDDGDTSTLEYANNFFPDTGDYNVMHIRQNSCGNVDTAYLTVSIDTTVVIPSWVVLDIWDNPVCPGDEVGMNTDGGYNSYQWNFGDGSPLLDTTSQYVYHIYADTGDYIVSVTFANGCGNDTTLFDTVFVVNTLGFQAGPGFDMDASSTVVCPGDNINFGAPWDYDPYEWNFGDGSPLETTSYNNISHSYNNYGTYTASVTFSNNCGVDTTLSTIISVVNNAPFTGNVDLYINTTEACPQQDINVWTQSGYKYYSWNFGDGSPAISGDKRNDANHSYVDTGTYIITLSVYNNCMSDTVLTQAVSISNNVGFPNAPWFVMDVRYSPSCPGSKVEFSAPFGYDWYEWDFGDSTSVVSSPISRLYHEFMDTGNYQVSVIITNQCGIDTLLFGDMDISNNAGFGNIGLDNYPNTACPGQTVNFSTQWGYPTYRWDFGDGTPPDTVTNRPWLSHQYSQAGSYTAAVTVTNYCGQDTILTTNLNIDSNLQIPSTAYISIQSTPACPGEEINFSTIGGNQWYVWTFGDGSPVQESQWGGTDHIYWDTGVYVVTVSFTNYCGFDTILVDSVVISDNVGFSGNLFVDVWPQPVCPGDEVHFDASSNYADYYWDFGDSSNAIGSFWANHTYDSAGTYYGTVTILNHCGLDTTLTGTIVVDANTTVPGGLTLYVSTPVACPDEVISFEVNASGFSYYVWNFGDGDTVVTYDDNVKHSYDTLGSYNVSVSVYNGCGNSEIVYTSVSVESDAPVPPNLSMWIPFASACPGDEIQILPMEGSSSYLYIWNFGDGQTDTTEGTAVNHSYADTGSYTISLTAINSCGSSLTVTNLVTIKDSLAPFMDSGESFGVPNGNEVAGCPGDAILFYFWGTGDNLWDFGDGWTDVATEQLVVEEGFLITIIKHAYSATGTYNVKHTRTNGCGISVTDSFSLTIGNNLLVNGDLLVETPVSQGGYTTCQPVEFLAIGGATYAWNFGDGDSLTSINPSVSHIYNSPGTYPVTVIITNGCGNSVTLTTMVSIYDVGSATVSTNILSNVTCYNGSGGSAEATVTGGEPPFTFTWSDPAVQTASVATNLSPGTFYVTVTDKVGCYGAGSVTLANPALISISTSDSVSSCGNATGSAFAAVTGGGNGPFTYGWSNGQTGQTATGLSAGNYSVTVTDINSCTAVSPVNIDDMNAPAVVINTINNASCFNGMNGSAAITVSGGVPPYSFIWSNGSTLEDPSNLAAGTYYLTVTDSAGCKASVFTTVSQPVPITVTFNTNGANCGASNGSATASPSGGTPPYSYQWDVIADNQTTQTATGLGAGPYDITITDANGCTTKGSVAVSNVNAPVVSAVVTNISCNGLTDGVIVQTVTGGTTGQNGYGYSWTTSPPKFTKNVNNLGPGNYTCIITDATNCIVVQTYTITQPAPLSATTAVTNTVCNHADGSVTATVSGGTAPYAYAWTGGGVSPGITGLPGGNYTVTVTDSQGCDTTASSVVAVAAAEQQICMVTVDEVLQKNVVVWEKTSGQSTAGYSIYKEISLNVYDSVGYIPYDSLSNFTDFASDPKTKSERYKVSAVDSCFNESTLSFAHKTMHVTASLGIIPPPYTERNLIWENYEGFTFGQYRIWRGTLAGNPMTLIDSVVSTTTTYSDYDTIVGADTLFYMIEIVLPNSCTATLKLKTYNSSKSNTASMQAPSAAISTSVTTTGVACNSGNNGSANVSVSGGTPPYTFLWSNAGSQSTVTGLNAGTYYVTVTDSKGDSVIDSAMVTEPGAITVSTSVTDEICTGADGSAVATAGGGTGGFTYIWSNGQSASNATGLAAGTYTVTATDGSGCTGSTTSVVNSNNIVLTLSASSTDATCDNVDGTATASASGGSGGYNYVWSDGQSNATATGLASGTYSVTATDSKGCSGNTSATVIAVNVPLTLLSTFTSVTCYGYSNGSATVLAASGTPPYIYQWNAAANNQTNATATGLAAGSYDVTVTDSKGCYNSQSVTVTEPAQIVLSVSSINSSCGNADGSATVSASGGTGGFTYSWSNGQTASTATTLAAGNYTVTVQDANNCSQTAIASVNDANAPSLTISATDVTCNGDGNGTATVSASAGTPPYTYLWDGGTGNQTDSTATGLSGGNYSVSVYDGVGCLATQSATVNEPAALAVTATVTDANAPGNNDGAIDITVTGGTGAYTYLWSTADVTEDLTGLPAGTYTVTVTDASNCEVVRTDTVDLINNAFYHIPYTTHQILIYPNPNRGSFRIELRNVKRKTENVKFKIRNTLGETVYYAPLPGAKFTMDLVLPEGVYALQVEAEGEIIGVARVVIGH